MTDTTKKWKYLSMGLIGILASLAILAAIPASEGAVPELRGSLLEKIFFAIETQHGVAHLNFTNYDLESGVYNLQSILDEGNGYFGDYKVHVVSGGQRVTLECGSSTKTPLFVAEPGVDQIFEGSYACNGVYFSVEDPASSIEGTISFTKGGFLEFS
jgi:hypothetical protein